ncbi:hypothetical protein M9Y10_022697 [Tritrichomonas musculus]|uniref:Uncharacterized protein n=1 Tax=Tritrichomonas musculus TaxID=1915356 RepID=A0ABR2KSZ9_9EUKA
MSSLGVLNPEDDFSDQYFDSGQYSESFQGFESFNDIYSEKDLIDFSFEDESNFTPTPIDSGQGNESPPGQYKSSLILKLRSDLSKFSTIVSQNLSNQPSPNKVWLVDFKDGSFTNHQSFGDPTRAPKRKVDLSRNELSFKDRFYAIFTTKKKFEKKLVKQIHNYIRKPFGFERMSREEFRRIDLYFQNYAKYSEQILRYLIHHQEEIFDKFLSKSLSNS